MRFSVEGKCPKVKVIDISEPTCECKVDINVGTGLIMEGNTISIDIDKMKELLKEQPPVNEQPVVNVPPVVSEPPSDTPPVSGETSGILYI